MSEEKTIVATDLEDFDEVDVIEVLVSEGEAVEVNQSIVTLESDKAMMEFPASSAGTVKSISVNVGDKIKQGDPLLVLSIESESVDSDEKNKGLVILQVEGDFRDTLEGKTVHLLDGQDRICLQGKIIKGEVSQEIEKLDEVDLQHLKVRPN